jgi:tetratricopeptide (TPR) repeat protein
MHHYREDLSQERLNLARAAADRSLGLEPELPEARIALGYYYYWGHKDYEQALEQFSLVNRADDPQVHEAVAYIHRRQGRFEDALAGLQSALELDPRSANLEFEAAITMALLRRYADADASLRRSIELSPNNAALHGGLVDNHIDWDGNLAAARRILDAMPASADPQRDLHGIQLARMEGRYQEALDALASTRAAMFQAQGYYWPPSLLQGQIFRLMGRPEEARAACEEARTILQGKVEEDGREHRYHAALGLVYACLGQGEDAVREATLGSDLYPISRDRYGGLAFVENLVLVLAQAGQADRALDRLEPLVTEPGETSWYAVSQDPLWQSLWDEPRFRALEAKLNYQSAPSR